MVAIKCGGIMKGCMLEIDESELQTMTVLQLKETLSVKCGTSPDCLRILSRGRMLRDNTKSVQEELGSSRSITVLSHKSDEQLNAEKVQEDKRLHASKLMDAAEQLASRVCREADGDRANGNAAGGGGSGGGGGSRRSRLPQMELLNQDGMAITMPEDQQRLIVTALMLHDQAKSKLRKAANLRTDRRRQLRRPRPGLSHPAQQAAGPDDDDDDGGGGGGGDDDNDFDSRDDVNASNAGNNSDGGNDSGGGDVKMPAGQKEAVAGNITPDEAGGKSGGDGNGDVVKTGETDTKRAEDAEQSAAGDGLTPWELEGEALQFLLKARDCLSQADQRFVSHVDNYPNMCLDVVWLLFLRRDLANLPLAQTLLLEAERGFARAHGPQLQNLIALKGEYSAELCLYPRLHLLQAVVAFHSGDEARAHMCLLKAREEFNKFSVSPVAVARLIAAYEAANTPTATTTTATTTITAGTTGADGDDAAARATSGADGSGGDGGNGGGGARRSRPKKLEPRVAVRALRASQGDMNGAMQYLQMLKERKRRQRQHERERAMERAQKVYGKTADGRSYVDVSLVDMLMDQGFKRKQVIAALGAHNNDAAAAIVSLTAPTFESLRHPPNGTSTGATDMDTGPDAVNSEAAAAAASKSGEDGMAGGSGDCGQEEGQQNGVQEQLDIDENLLREIEENIDGDEEAYLDISLLEEGRAITMYLHLLQGTIPMFDLELLKRDAADLVQQQKKKKTATEEQLASN